MFIFHLSSSFDRVCNFLWSKLTYTKTNTFSYFHSSLFSDIMMIPRESAFVVQSVVVMIKMWWKMNVKENWEVDQA